ncbi:MAG: translocation/assembly module TamB domain-containing protein [Saprospiraceae bacterium]
MTPRDENNGGSLLDIGRGSIIWKWTRRIILTTIVLLFIALLLLQISSVQTYLGKKVTTYLSEKTETNISANKLIISPWDGAIVQGVTVVKDMDTLFSGGSINLSVTKNLFFVLNNTLDLSFVGLRDIDLNIHTKVGEGKSNLSAFLSHFASENKNSKTVLNLGLRQLQLNNIRVKIHNENNGKKNFINVTEGEIILRHLDLACNAFDIKSITLDGPVFFTEVYDYTCEIDDELAISKSDKSPILDLLNFDGGAREFDLNIGKLNITNGKFGKSNALIVPVNADWIDFQNFYFDKINLSISNFSFISWKGMEFQNFQVSAIDNHGFVIENVGFDSVTVAPNMMDFTGFKLNTQKSFLSDKISMSYGSTYAFRDFLNEVSIQCNFIDSKVYIGDLLHFVGSLDRNTFLSRNKNETVHISGKYFGRINNLGGNDMHLRMWDYFEVEGIFNTRDLLDSDNTLLNVRVDRLNTSTQKIKTIFPQFNAPENFEKLGNLNFSGRFDGYLHDFVAYGNLNSDLGITELDMRLDLSEGSAKARYSGNLNLFNFDLGRWSDNPDLGRANFKSKVTDGFGLTLNTVKADLLAVIESLTFKSYEYKNLVLNGIIEKNTFDGKFTSADPNIQLLFDGEIQFLNNKAFLNFTSEIDNLDLHALNLYKSPLAFSGDLSINTSGSNLNDFIGEIDFSDVKVKKQDTVQVLEKIKLIARQSVSGTRYIMLDGDFVQGEIEGIYNVEDIFKGLKSTALYHFNGFTKSKETTIDQVTKQDFKFKLKLDDSQNILSLMAVPIHSIKKLNLKGHINTDKHSFSVAGRIGEIWYKDQVFKSIDILTSASDQNGSFIASVEEAKAFGTDFYPVYLNTSFSGDALTFDVSTERLLDSFEQINIKGNIKSTDKGISLDLDNTTINMLGAAWKVTEGNTFLFGKGFVNIDNFNITDGNRTIDVYDINDSRGVHVELQNFDINLLNRVMKEEKFKLSGVSSISVQVNDIFEKSKSIQGYINVPDFQVNKTGYGNLFVDFGVENSNDIKVKASLGEFFGADLLYAINSKSVDGKAKLRDAPLDLLQHLLKDGISNTTGKVVADIKINGKGKDIVLSGKGHVKDGSTRVLVNGATYYFDNQYFTVSEKDIVFENVIIKDENGNDGIIQGKLTHALFKNFGVEASVTGKNIIGLNTTKADNDVYYGYGIGDFNVVFKGLFSDLFITIQGVTREGSRLYIPVNNTGYVKNESVIKFVSKTDTTFKEKERDVSNITLEMTLSITPDAEASIIFDEAKGDIIKGRGRGDLFITMSKNEDLEMFGTYEIEQGEYLFTVSLLPVAKPFVVERGGLIRWTGDPLNTTLDITANYRSRTSISPFIEEYLTLAPEETQRAADQRTDVDLKLILGGTLFSPIISFDVSFPNLAPELASFADSKLRLIRNNELELNSQVLGLIVLNTFLPSNSISDLFGTDGLQSVGVNTLSEFLSSQLSMHITNLLNSVISDNGVLSDVDFELGLHNNAISGNLYNSSILLPDEINFTLKNKFKFLDERFSLNLGANYILQNQGVAVNQVLPDYAIEFLLTDDKKLKIRHYGRSDIDPVNLGQLRQKYGFGIGYRTEFGNVIKLTPAPDTTSIQ